MTIKINCSTFTSKNHALQPYKYNGKEWIEMHGLDEYDSQARMYYPAIMRTTTLDPLAEKYYSISPYAWCGNNPVMRIDPDGMDWYEWDEEKKRAVIWQEGNAKQLEINGQTYNNVGENYSYTLGNTTYSFEQQKMVSMSVTVLDNNQFQTQFDSRFGDEKRQKVACKRACNVIESNAGVTSAGRNDATQQVGREVGTADNHSIVPTGNQANGDKTLVRDVEVNGNPVIVGVDRGMHGRGINDGTTDHWIVVSGYTYNLTNGTTSYNYFDPGNRNAAQGANAANVLMRTSDGMLRRYFENPQKIYTVTNIRPNR